MAEQAQAVEAPLSITDRIAASRAPETAPEPADAPMEAQPEESVADASIVDEEGAEAPVEAAPESAETGEAGEEIETESDETVSVSSLGDLAEHLGVEASDLYDLVLPVPDGDSRVDMTLGELKDAAQAYRAAEKQRDALKADKQAFEAEMATFREERDRSMRETAAVLELVENQLTSEAQAIDWNALREADPAEWTAKRQEFAERQQAINQVKHEAAMKFAEFSEQEKAKQQAHAQEVHAREREALLNALPEWRDETVMKSEVATLRDYLAGSGFNEQEIDNASDHRSILLARKAMLYDKQQQAVDTAKKRVVKIGRRTLRPGTPQKTTARDDRIASTSKRLRESGNVNDAAAAIAARRKG